MSIKLNHTIVHARDKSASATFPALLGALLWGGLYFRDERLRALLPLRS